MNTPQFKISGPYRRQLKKELSILKSRLRNTRHFNDLCSVLGGPVMSEEEITSEENSINSDIQNLEIKLKELI